MYMCQFFNIAKKGCLECKSRLTRGMWKSVVTMYVLEIKTQNMKDIKHVRYKKKLKKCLQCNLCL